MSLCTEMSLQSIHLHRFHYLNERKCSQLKRHLTHRILISIYFFFDLNEITRKERSLRIFTDIYLIYIDKMPHYILDFNWKKLPEPLAIL